MNQLRINRRAPSEIVEEYHEKWLALSGVANRHEELKQEIERARVIGGTWSGVSVDYGRVYLRILEESLLKSAWRHVWKYYDLDTIASAETKRRVELMFEKPPAFTVENIREQFGDLIADPWGSVLTGLAEVFSSLDPAFKSHEKVKIGVKGLPKRVIIGGIHSIHGYGRDKIRDILNAIAAYEGKPLVEYMELTELLDNGNVMLSDWKSDGSFGNEGKEFPARGVWLKKFANGNGHLYFTPETLLSVNRALAEYYGDVLPDAYTKRESPTGTAVSKDLQFYPTPLGAAQRLCDTPLNGKRVLEPSCGDGRLMDLIRDAGGDAVGIEYHAGRAEQARTKGHSVMQGNFLETIPTGDFDVVIMNPPFAGKHYEKHIRHALKFLKDGGELRSILPATARYDHKILDDLCGRWVDLPVGSFKDSGTNINTVILEVRK